LASSSARRQDFTENALSIYPIRLEPGTEKAVLFLGAMPWEEIGLPPERKENRKSRQEMGTLSVVELGLFRCVKRRGWRG
jgi:hypothetical protein